MKILFFIFLFVQALLAQPLFLLMGGEGIGEYPVTADLVASWDEREMSASGWNDQTGTTDFAQATETNQPLLVANGLNGYPALRFNGSDNYMAEGTFTIGTYPYTIYFVAKVITWSDGDALLNGGANGFTISLGGGGTNIYCYAGAYGTVRSFGTGTYKIGGVVVNGASGLFQVNDDVLEGDTGQNGIIDGLVLGADHNHLNFSNIEIVCLYIHTTAHDLATRTQIIDWLNSKYGVY